MTIWARGRENGVAGRLGQVVFLWEVGACFLPILLFWIYIDNEDYPPENRGEMDISAYIDTTLQAVKSKNTYRAYQRCLLAFEHWYTAINQEDFGHSAILSFMAWLESANVKEPRKAQYYIQHLAAIKPLAKTMGDNKAIDLYEVTVIRGIEPPKIETATSGDMVNDDDMKAILRVCAAKGDIGARDAAILTMLHSTGIRRSEAAFLHTSHVDRQKITVRETKNNQDRIVYLNAGSREHLDKWMAIRGNDPGYVFLKFKRHKKEFIITNEGIDPQSVYVILRNRIRQSGVESNYKPHDFRKTFISTLLNKGNDPMAIAHLSGHRSTDTIRKYDLTVSERAKKAAKDIYTPGLDELD